jgi:hypothetical protein
MKTHPTPTSPQSDILDLQTDPLNSQAFHDLMRYYTLAVNTDINLTIPAMEAVKKWLRDNLITPTKP